MHGSAGNQLPWFAIWAAGDSAMPLASTLSPGTVPSKTLRGNESRSIRKARGGGGRRHIRHDLKSQTHVGKSMAGKAASRSCY